MNRPPPHVHGKEGVDGSSPSEGFHKVPANGHVVLPVVARFRFFAGTRRVHFGTSGHSQARVTSRDTVWNVLEMIKSRPLARKTPANYTLCCPRRRDTDPSTLERGSSHAASPPDCTGRTREEAITSRRASGTRAEAAPCCPGLSVRQLGAAKKMICSALIFSSSSSSRGEAPAASPAPHEVRLDRRHHQRVLLVADARDHAGAAGHNSLRELDQAVHVVVRVIGQEKAGALTASDRTTANRPKRSRQQDDGGRRSRRH
jgi:hypothetical protein